MSLCVGGYLEYGAASISRESPATFDLTRMYTYSELDHQAICYCTIIYRSIIDTVKSVVSELILFGEWDYGVSLNHVELC